MQETNSWLRIILKLKIVAKNHLKQKSKESKRIMLRVLLPSKRKTKRTKKWEVSHLGMTLRETRVKVRVSFWSNRVVTRAPRKTNQARIRASQNLKPTCQTSQKKAKVRDHLTRASQSRCSIRLVANLSQRRSRRSRWRLPSMTSMTSRWSILRGTLSEEPKTSQMRRNSCQVPNAWNLTDHPKPSLL